MLLHGSEAYGLQVVQCAMKALSSLIQAHTIAMQGMVGALDRLVAGMDGQQGGAGHGAARRGQARRRGAGGGAAWRSGTENEMLSGRMFENSKKFAGGEAEWIECNYDSNGTLDTKSEKLGEIMESVESKVDIWGGRGGGAFRERGRAGRD